MPEGRRKAVPAWLRAVRRAHLALLVIEHGDLNEREAENVAANLDKTALLWRIADILNEYPDAAKSMRQDLSSADFRRRAERIPGRPAVGLRVFPPKRMPGLTARQMMRATPYAMKENARHVRVRSIKRLRTSKGRFAFVSTMTDPDHAWQEQPHHQRIDVLRPRGESDIFDKGSRLKVSCDCGNFLYTWEVALARRGAADIVYSNGRWPKVTNPQGVPGVCKHLYRLFAHLKTQGPTRKWRKAKETER